MGKWPGTDQIAAVVTLEVGEEFRALCRAEDRSLSNELGRLIRKRLAEYGNDDERLRQSNGAAVQTSVTDDRHEDLTAA